MATFGTTTIGGTTAALEPDKMTVSREAKPLAGTLSKLTVYIADGTAAGSIKLKALVYADTAEGKPGALLAEGTEVVYTHGEGNKWLDLPLAAALDVTAPHVHIGWKFGGTNNVAKFAYDATGAEADHHFQPATYTTAAPAEWPASGFNNQTFSVYGTYTQDPPAITNPGAQTNTVGLPINEVWPVATNVESWSATGLPPGITINASTGHFSGTPSTVGVFNVALTAHGEPNTEITFTWTIQSAAAVGSFRGITAFSPFPGNLGAPDSPFNLPVPASPTVATNSAAMVNWLLSETNAGMGVAHSRNQFPTVYARNTDPLVKIIDTAKGFYHEKSIRIPVAAKVQSNSDKHLQVVLCPSDCAALGVTEGTTADFWHCGGETDPSETVNYELGGTQLHVSSSGKGNVLGAQVFFGKSVAANFDLNAGVIRGPELQARFIPHALVAVCHDVAKAPAAIYPANHSDGESTDPRAPAMGQRFYLAMSHAEIDAAGLPYPVLAAVAKAVADYGFYLEDTGGTKIGLRTENDNMETAFGAPGYMARVCAEEGISADSEGTVIDFGPLTALFTAHLKAIGPPVLGTASLNHCDVFPPGTTVGAWPITNRQGDQRPAGQPVASATADGAGGLALVLPPAEYVLWGEVAGHGRAMVLALGG